VQGITDPTSKTNTGKNLVERVRWAAWKEAEVSIVLGDLEWPKLSLTNSHAQHHSIVSPQPAADEATLILPAHRQSTQVRGASLAQLHIAVEQIPSRHHPRYPSISERALYSDAGTHRASKPNIQSSFRV
jgi:hypothetical protein